jgi:nucleotide-binding universal stress UspA family protein
MMTANSRIVVGVDGSMSSMCAVRWAAQTAARHNAPLLLLSAWTVPVAGYRGMGVPPSFFDDQVAEGRRRLGEATRIAHESAPGGELSVTTELVAGPAVAALIESSRDARMIVLGSRGLGEFTGGLLGSVTAALAHHAHSPVAVIRESPHPTAQGPVVVGVDGSTNSEPAIAMAFEEASLRGTDLIAVHAWSDVTRPVPPLHHHHGLPWTSRDTAEDAVLAESLAGFTERYPDVTVHRIVVQDQPLRHLLSHADTAALLVVGSHGRGGFTNMLLGSTSTALLHTAQCPLLIVRNPH